MQTVHSRDSLKQIVTLEVFVNIKDGVSGFVKAGQQLVHNDQDIWCAIGAKSFDDISFISVRIIAHIRFPPGLHLRCLCIICIINTNYIRVNL